jgi:hypothetical protein
MSRLLILLLPRIALIASHVPDGSSGFGAAPAALAALLSTLT